MQPIIFPEYISLNIPFIIILLIAGVAATFSYWLYKKTVPEIKSPVRYVLMTLRTIVFLLIMVLLFSPKLSLIYQEEILPKVAIFIDNSASMGIDGRFQETEEVIRGIKNNLPDNLEVYWYQFNDKISRITGDSLMITEYGTNFDAVIKESHQMKFSKIIILSDGNNTESRVFSELPIPIIAIGIGKINTGADIYISDLKYNSVARLNNDEIIEVQIGNIKNNFNRKIKLNLFAGKNLIKSKIIQDMLPGTEQGIQFSYIPHRTGLIRYTVIMDTLKGEENVKNNRRTFVQKTIKKNRSIGLFIGIPDYDSKFISLLLSEINDFDVFKYVDHINNYNSPEYKLDSLDVIFFSNFPGPFTTAKTLNILKNVFSKRHPGLIIKQGKQNNLAKLKIFNSLLPFNDIPKKISMEEIHVSNFTDPLLNLFTNTYLNNEFWQKIPPLNIQYIPESKKKRAKTILSGLINEKEIPVITILNQGKNRTAYMNGEGYWRWYFTLKNYPDLISGYKKLLSNLVYWVSNTSKLNQVTLHSDRRIFKLGEKIRLRINLYDSNFDPLTTGNVEMNISWNKQSFNVDAVNDSSGNYLAEFYPPGEGKYIINARGYSGGLLLGQVRLILEVIPVEKEFLTTSQNVEFLKNIAKRSGGTYFNNTVESDSLLNQLQIKPSTEIKENNIDLWYKPVLLIIIIILITLEWILRKKNRLL